MAKFACRMCRKEVKLDENGVANHLDDGSPACIVKFGDTPMPNWDRHEIIEEPSNLEGGDPSSNDLDVASQLEKEEKLQQGEEVVETEKEGGE